MTGVGEFDPFAYRARLFPVTSAGPVVDGDTQHYQLDQGFYDYTAEVVRLDGVDTHETRFVSHDSEEYERGKEQKRYVEAWLAEGQREWPGWWPFIIDCESFDPRGDYDRVLARVIRRSDEAVLNDDLLDEYGEEIRYEE